MRTEDAREALRELANRAASAGSGWGAWLIKLPDGGWEVFSPVTRYTTPGLEAGEELALWLEVRPSQAPNWPEAWGEVEILEEVGFFTRSSGEDFLEEVLSFLQELKEKAEAGDTQAEEVLDRFYFSARVALAWAELEDQVLALDDTSLREELLEALAEARSSPKVESDGIEVGG